MKGNGWDGEAPDGPARLVGLAGSPNFRDFGGYRSGAGRHLKWRCLFRSGHLAALNEADRERLRSLDLQLVVDLRRLDEQAQEPSWLPDGIAVHSANINPGSQANALVGQGAQISSGNAMFHFMCDINRQFVEAQSTTFAAVLAELLDSGAERLLIHCSAGKDRTGFLVAMLQLALGVSREDVLADYLLSARYYLPEQQLSRARRRYAVDHLADDDLLPLLRADAAYLNAAFAAIEAGFGGVEGYLRQGLGLDDGARRELQRRFLL